MSTKAFRRAAERAPSNGGRVAFRGHLWIRRDRDGAVILGQWASALVRVAPDGRLSVQTDGYRPGMVSKALSLALWHTTGRAVSVDGRRKPFVIRFLDTGETLPVPSRWQHIT